MAEKIRLAVFISGSGTNLQSIIDNCVNGFIPGEVALVVSSKADAYGLVRAEKAGIPGVVHIRKNFPDGGAADRTLLETLDQYKID
jgi:phosphoribosylglycinamide formyltransferase-1